MIGRMTGRSVPRVLSERVALRCPFCGALAEIQSWHGGGRDKRRVSCANDSCDVSPAVTGSTRKRALAKWNTRRSRA